MGLPTSAMEFPRKYDHIIASRSIEVLGYHHDLSVLQEGISDHAIVVAEISWPDPDGPITLDPANTRFPALVRTVFVVSQVTTSPMWASACSTTTMVPSGSRPTLGRVVLQLSPNATRTQTQDCPRGEEPRTPARDLRLPSLELWRLL